MRTDLLKVVWLGCTMATVVFGRGIGLNAGAVEPPKDIATAKTNAVASTNKPPVKPTDAEAKPDEKKKVLKADTNPGTIFTNSIDMELVRLPAGYWAGKYEVTQKQYQKVMDANPSQFPGDDLPVDSVSWNEAVEFCKKLTALERKEEFLPTGHIYALPAEGQWETLVAEAGPETAVTSDKQRRSGTVAAGSLPPNALGLHDVRGNVMEWCQGDNAAAFRVLRGAAWNTSFEVNLRPAFRHYARPDERQNAFGFRVVLISE